MELPTLPTALRPFFAAILAPWITLLLAWITGKTGVVYDPETQSNIVVMSVALIFSVMASGSAIIKVFINKKANPGNAASAQLASMEKDQTEALKAKA